MFEDPEVLAFRDAQRNVKAAVIHINHMLDSWPPVGPQPQLAVSATNRIGLAMAFNTERRPNGTATSAATLAVRLALKVQIDHLNSLLDAWAEFPAEPSLQLDDGKLAIVPPGPTGRAVKRDGIKLLPTRR